MRFYWAAMIDIYEFARILVNDSRFTICNELRHLLRSGNERPTHDAFCYHSYVNVKATNENNDVKVSKDRTFWQCGGDNWVKALSPGMAVDLIKTTHFGESFGPLRPGHEAKTATKCVLTAC